jgi:hypothetical protein
VSGKICKQYGKLEDLENLWEFKRKIEFTMVAERYLAASSKFCGRDLVVA